MKVGNRESENVLTTDEIHRLETDGFLALEGVVSQSQLTAMRTRLLELLRTTPQKNAGTLIVNGLLDDDVFDAAWNHPRVLSAVESVLREPGRLLGVFSRGLRAGHGQQELHSDWGRQGLPNVWYVCHAICPLVDFTAENGATRVVPGSHRNPWMMKGVRDPRLPHPNQKQLVGKAGTVFVLNVHCQHSAVQNTSTHDRLAVFSSFSRRDSPLLLMQPPEPVRQDVIERFDHDTRRLLTD